ncbi:hypothetical protein PsYK624_162930 [Phanerochaete sordida]|uniref:Uncharacterized protein n=1 Tax=Phanerochaete sordida TaxID=48140 RepID=A0A9P3LM40_9APHY|nr:hypothetical protein PsYK624_162930 [Phanerochaete sordida]
MRPFLLNNRGALFVSFSRVYHPRCRSYPSYPGQAQPVDILDLLYHHRCPICPRYVTSHGGQLKQAS